MTPEHRKMFENFCARADAPTDIKRSYAVSLIRELLADVDKLRTALTELESAADVFQANQSRATDPRCGLVQPVSVAECERLNAAILKAREALK